MYACIYRLRKLIEKYISTLSFNVGLMLNKLDAITQHAGVEKQSEYIKILCRFCLNTKDATSTTNIMFLSGPIFCNPHSWP